MKTLSLIFILFTTYSFSQVKFPLSKFPMYSNIWKMYCDNSEKDEDGLPLIIFEPKSEFRTFGNDCPAFINVNKEKVQSILISELNKFRKDYKLGSIIKNTTLTKKSITDAKKLSEINKYKINKESGVKTIYDRIPVDFFSRVDTKKYNLEKVIAESVYDWFVANDEGMSLLLSKSKKEFGVGVYISESSGVTVVIRAK